MKNKKGIIGIIALIVIGVLIISGGLTAWKISQITSEIPTWLWYLIAFIIIIMLLRKKK